jgi:hypothetical protein
VTSFNEASTVIIGTYRKKCIGIYKEQLWWGWEKVKKALPWENKNERMVYIYWQAQWAPAPRSLFVLLEVFPTQRTIVSSVTYRPKLLTLFSLPVI